MASTRNNNTYGNYCLRQLSYQEQRDYRSYKNGGNGYAYDSKLPGNGLLAGQVPYHLLSKNAADIESFLWGVNSTNLTLDHGVQPCLVPQLNRFESANIYEKGPTYLPQPLVVEKKQRPFPAP